MKIRFIAALTLLLALCNMGYAQYSLNGYFMPESTQSNMLNPAFTPDHGYFLLPVIGGTGAQVSSNSLSIDKLFYNNPTGENNLVWFLDVDIDKSDLINSLADDNYISSDITTTIFGAGFHRKNVFWSYGVNLRATSDLSIPSGVFDLAVLNQADNVYDINNLNASLSAYLESYVGASFNIGKVAVGAKVKFLMGLLDASIEYDNMQFALNDNEWSISSKGHIDATAAGLSLKNELSGFSFDNLDYAPKFGISGYGLGFDLGASYDICKNLTISASALDLGFITWNKSNSISAESASSYTYSGAIFSSNGAENENFDIDDILTFNDTESQNRTRSLNSTFNVAAEYRMLGDRIAAGVLYTSRLRLGYTENEITAVASFRPTGWLTANASYSFMESQIGAAINLHPCWINLFVGMDYIPSSVTTQYLPISESRINMYVGVAIPLASKSK